MNEDPDFPLPDVEWPPAREFWAAAARRRLALPRCRACATLNAVGELSCRRCHGEAMSWEPLSGFGTLYSWTFVHRAFLPQLASEVPYLTGLVDVAEDPQVRIVTRLTECDPDELRIGMPVEVTFVTLPFPGHEVLAPYFRPRRQDATAR